MSCFTQILNVVRVFYVLLLIIIFHHNTAAQNADVDASDLSKKLAKPSHNNNESYLYTFNILKTLDSTEAFNLLNKISKEPSSKGPYFLARYNCLMASTLLRFNPSIPDFSSNFKENIKEEVTELLEEAIQQAYISDDDFLTAFVSYIYGDIMKGFQKTSKAVMYMMYSAELNDKVQQKGEFGNYFGLGELLWKIREYKKCIQYTKTAMSVLGSEVPQRDRYEMMCNNTIGLAYNRMGKQDSAMYYYQLALKLSDKLNDPASTQIWTGIISGNIAQIEYAHGKYADALPLFILDYTNNNEIGYYGDAANSLQWAAKTNLALGNKEIALQQIRQTFQLLQKWPTAFNYKKNAYQTAAEIFHSVGNYDSALYYGAKYNLLNDSLERVVYLSSLDISQLRLNNDKSRYNIKNLELKKNEQLQQRNYIIAGIILFCVIVLLLINRQRLKLKFSSEREHNEKLRIQEEMENARVQLKMFTQSTIEKTNLIEKLEMQVQDQLNTEDQTQLMKELSRQTILTEEDWLKFKDLFEKINPRFFEKLTSQVNNITQSEQRMAALTLLHLTTKQMAAVLGISPNSVIKSRQRLRQRLDFSSDQEVEEFIKNL